MNALVSRAKTDPTLEQQGIWREYSPDGQKTFRVLLARAGGSNIKFLKAAEEVYRPIRTSGVDPAKIPVDAQREKSGKLYAEAIVLGWNEEDFEQPFSQQAVMDTFRQVPDFLEWCIGEATKADSYRRQAVAEYSGKSPDLSNTMSSTGE